MCTRTKGCIYSCCTPDDGLKKRPKHVEWSTSEIKVTTQLHRVGLFNNYNDSSGGEVFVSCAGTGCTRKSLITVHGHQ